MPESTEMTLKQWVEELHEYHRARKEYESLLLELDRLRLQQASSTVKEQYPDSWGHCVVHLNPDTDELHVDGEYSARQLVLDRLAQGRRSNEIMEPYYNRQSQEALLVLFIGIAIGFSISYWVFG